MKIKIEAGDRLEAGWFDALSDIAKKAYLKLHPNSKVGGKKPHVDKPTSNSPGLAAAQEEHKKAKAAYSKIRDSGGGDRTDSEWARHDAALKRLERATDKLLKLKGK